MNKQTKFKYIMLFTAPILHFIIGYFHEDIGRWGRNTYGLGGGMGAFFFLSGIHIVYYTVIIIVSIVFAIQIAISIYRIKHGTIPKMETEIKVKIIAVCLILFCDIVQRMLGVGVTWLWR